MGSTISTVSGKRKHSEDEEGSQNEEDDGVVDVVKRWGQFLKLLSLTIYIILSSEIIITFANLSFSQLFMLSKNLHNFQPNGHNSSKCVSLYICKCSSESTCLWQYQRTKLVCNGSRFPRRKILFAELTENSNSRTCLPLSFLKDLPIHVPRVTSPWPLACLWCTGVWPTAKG